MNVRGRRVSSSASSHQEKTKFFSFFFFFLNSAASRRSKPRTFCCCSSGSVCVCGGVRWGRGVFGVHTLTLSVQCCRRIVPESHRRLPPPSSGLLLQTVQVPCSVVDLPRDLHVDATVVHHVHGPLLWGQTEGDGHGLLWNHIYHLDTRVILQQWQRPALAQWLKIGLFSRGLLV